MPKVKTPRKGSLAYYPRKRARRIYPRLTSYPDSDKICVLGFGGYKAGMGHVILLDTNKGSKTFGQEISKACTILECPPMKVIGIRAYENTRGLSILGDVWVKELPKDVSRKMELKKPNTDFKVMDSNVDRISNIRVMASTQPRLSGIGKKTPEIFEIEIGGKNINEKLEFSKKLLGKEVSAKDIFQIGEVVDVVAVTKGKGIEGPVKRFGVKIQVRHAKKKRRHIGALGSQTPRRVLWTVAQAGQLGFQTRTEFNKRILKIGEGKEINPKSGFKRYGIIKNDYIIIEGSVPGSKKRLVMLRPAIRPPKVRILVPEIRGIMV